MRTWTGSTRGAAADVPELDPADLKEVLELDLAFQADTTRHFTEPTDDERGR